MLLEKIGSGKLTPEEEEIAKYWLLRLNEEDNVDLTEAELEDISREMWASLETLPNVRPKVRRLRPRIAAAASILLILSAGSYFIFKNSRVKQQSPLVARNDVAPAGNQAYLTLSNGQKIILGKQSGRIASQGNASIAMNVGGTVELYCN